MVWFCSWTQPELLGSPRHFFKWSSGIGLVAQCVLFWQGFSEQLKSNWRALMDLSGLCWMLYLFLKGMMFWSSSPCWCKLLFYVCQFTVRVLNQFFANSSVMCRHNTCSSFELRAFLWSSHNSVWHCIHFWGFGFVPSNKGVIEQADGDYKMGRGSSVTHWLPNKGSVNSEKSFSTAFQWQSWAFCRLFIWSTSQPCGTVIQKSKQTSSTVTCVGMYNFT